MTRGKLVKVGVAAAVLTAGGAIAGEAVKPDVKTNDVKPVVVSERIQQQMDEFKFTRGMETDGKETDRKELRKTSDLEDNYEWRWFAWYIDIGGIEDTSGYFKWTYKKNGSPITNSAGGDTTYTLTVGGEEYLCGTFLDYVSCEGGDPYSVRYNYRQGETMSDLEARWEGVTPMNSLSFGYWDSTATRWIESVRCRGPPGPTITRSVTYVEVTDDSVYSNAGSSVQPRPPPNEYKKSYYVDHTPYYLSIPLSIHETDNKPQTIDLKIYPNPFNAQFSVELDEKVNGVLTLYDVMGNVVDKKLLDNSDKTTFEAGDLSSGQYFIRLVTEEGKQISKQITLIK